MGFVVLGPDTELQAAVTVVFLQAAGSIQHLHARL